MLITVTNHFRNTKEVINSDHIISMTEKIDHEGKFEYTQIVFTYHEPKKNYCFKERMVDIVEHVEEVWRVRMRTK